MALDKIEALEERITKIIELVKQLKDDKARLASEVTGLQEAWKTAEDEIVNLKLERDQVRTKLENLLQGIEGLGL